MTTNRVAAVGALALLLAAVVAVVGAVVLALDVSGVVRTGALVAALAGATAAWWKRDQLRPADGGSSNRWWLVAAVVLGGVLVSTPYAIQLFAISAVAGFLVACSAVVVGRHFGDVSTTA